MLNLTQHPHPYIYAHICFAGVADPREYCNVAACVLRAYNVQHARHASCPCPIFPVFFTYVYSQRRTPSLYSLSPRDPTPCHAYDGSTHSIYANRYRHCDEKLYDWMRDRTLGTRGEGNRSMMSAIGSVGFPGLDDVLTTQRESWFGKWQHHFGF